jgi:hypothetical protein
MGTKRKVLSYWRRRNPPKIWDISELRPETLSKGQRFETTADVLIESRRSEAALRNARSSIHLQEYLSGCRDQYCACERTYCPGCGRDFRRWFIGQVLRVACQCQGPFQIITVLLASSANIDDLDPIDYRHLLRKRLDRANLGNAHVIGGFEIVWRSRDKLWVLHVNLLILGGTETALARFEGSFSSRPFVRPTQSVPLNDLPKQISYLLKFTTYQRPLRQTDSKRSPAKPLNARDHAVLVNWMSQYGFADMMFLYGVRRQGDRLVTSRRLRG